MINNTLIQYQCQAYCIKADNLCSFISVYIFFLIQVGAVESFGPDLSGSMKGKDYLAYFSSRGPSADGRIKPDIVAPGE